MKLVIGGCAQGKLDYVLRECGKGCCEVWDGVLPRGEETAGRTDVVNHFHLWVRRRMKSGGCPEEEIEEFLRRRPSCVIISDEIGSGIVPTSRFEREWRERTGRILTGLASRSGEVVRVVCGIGQRIK